MLVPSMRGRPSWLALTASLAFTACGPGPAAVATAATATDDEPEHTAGHVGAAELYAERGRPDADACSRRGAPRRRRHRRVQQGGRFGHGGDPRALPGRDRADARRQRLRQGDPAPVRVLPRHVGRRARPDPSRSRWPRLHDRGGGRLLRVLQGRPRAVRAHRDRPDDGLVRLRPRRVADHRAQLDLRSDRRLRRGIQAGRLAAGGAGRAPGTLLSRRHPQPALQLGPQGERTPGPGRCGRSCTQPVRRWSSAATTTPTSGWRR